MDVKMRMIELRNDHFSSRLGAAHAVTPDIGPEMPGFPLPDAEGRRLPSVPSGTRR